LKISKSFGRRRLFHDVTGTLVRGQIVIVTGVNGSGKSTFLKIAAGLLSPDSGDVVRPAEGRMGYLSPSLELYTELTGTENLQFFAGIAGLTDFDPDRALSTVGLSRAGSKLYSNYSSGMKQRLKLAFSTLRSPELLILDEPTLALDSEGVQVVDDIIMRHRSGGGAALIATNDESECRRWCDSRLEIGNQAW
jgi:ABC-type multidrug transport system ATPase subunit